MPIECTIQISADTFCSMCSKLAVFIIHFARERVYNSFCSWTLSTYIIKLKVLSYSMREISLFRYLGKSKMFYNCIICYHIEKLTGPCSKRIRGSFNKYSLHNSILDVFLLQLASCVVSMVKINSRIMQLQTQQEQEVFVRRPHVQLVHLSGSCRCCMALRAHVAHDSCPREQLNTNVCHDCKTLFSMIVKLFFPL